MHESDFLQCLFQRVNQHVNHLHQQLTRHHGDTLLFFQREVIPYSQFLLQLSITNTLSVCDEGIDNITFLSMLSTDASLSQDQFEQTLLTYFLILFPKVRNHDEFLYHYNNKFYKKILHRKVIRAREEIIFFHFVEKIQMNGELYRYKMLFNDCFGEQPEWPVGMLLSNIYWHDKFHKLEMNYHPLLISRVLDPMERYVHVYPTREITVEPHYSMTHLEVNSRSMTISLFGANLLLFGNEIGYDSVDSLSEQMNVNPEIIRVWISHLVKYNVSRQVSPTRIEFGEVMEVVPTPMYQKIHYNQVMESHRCHVIEKRPEIIDAYIVKALKQKMTLSKQDLYACVKQQITFFQVTEDDFEREIGTLTKKEYLVQEGEMCSYVM